MPSLDDTFRAVGVTSARDKILALCNAPALFFDLKLTEDQIMVSFVGRLCGQMLLDELLPNVEDKEDILRHNLKYWPLYKHIMNSVFDAPDVAARRNIAYSMQDPKYLDALIEWIKDMMVKWDAIHKEFRANLVAMTIAETNYPLMFFNSEYKKYYDEKLSKHSGNT